VQVVVLAQQKQGDLDMWLQKLVCPLQQDYAPEPNTSRQYVVHNVDAAEGTGACR
jgi:hypothetical protein